MKKTKNIKSILMLGIIAITSMVLVACGSVALNTEENIKEQMFEKEEYLLANVYGKDNETDFNTSGSQNYIVDENYYIKIATEVEGDVAQIKLGEVIYAKTDKASTKVSSVNSLTRNAFMLNEGQLFVSNVLMFLNTSNDGVLKINFPKNNFKQIEVKVYEGQENKLGLKVVQVTAETLSVVDEMALKYKFKIDNPNGKAFLELKEADQSLVETEMVMLQTVANPDKANQSYASRFENPTTIQGVENRGIEIAPGYLESGDYEPKNPKNHTLVYNVYVPGVGTRTAVIEFENTKKA